MPEQYDSPAFRSKVLQVKNTINDIKNSGNYYVSNEINNELDAIDDGLNHLHFEGTIQDTSNDLRGHIQSEAGQGQAQDVGRSIEKASAILGDYKDLMNSFTVSPYYVGRSIEKASAILGDYKDLMNSANYSSKQENQMRELHHWAMLSLKDVQNEILPHTYKSWRRLYNFKNDVGVTDLYTGFRNNVARPREPCEPNSHWTGKPSVRFIETKSGQLRRPANRYDMCRSLSAPAGRLAKQGPPVCWTGDLSRTKLGHQLPPKVVTRGYRTIDSLYPRETIDSRLEPPDYFHHQSVENLRPADFGPHIVDKKLSTWTERKPTVQEAAGINMTFPGKTEYMSNFPSPSLNRLGGGYTINPNPNFEIHGRRLMDMVYHPKSTEYQSRFDWPSGDKIVKFPWLRR